MCGCGIDTPCFGGCPCGCGHTGPADVRYYRDRRGFVGVPNPENHDMSARPVVVLDPEDREQVERLVTHWFDGDDPGEQSITDMQAALRSLIAPPRPDEPQGDGALVECEYDGKRGRAVRLGGCWTFYGESLRDSGAMYDDFESVRVISEGVTA